MTVIRRSGAREAFSVDIVKASLAAASDEARQPMSGSDLSYITTELAQILEGKETITSQQVIIIVSGLLYTKGYFGVLEHYLAYMRKRVY